jgi:hypothetical protein
MSITKINYKQARKLILNHFKNEKIILSKFCIKNKISYQQLMNLKNNPNKPYPTTAKHILKGLGYATKIEKVTFFYIQNNPPKK